MDNALRHALNYFTNNLEEIMETVYYLAKITLLLTKN